VIIFLSYAEEDRAQVSQIHGKLTEAGYRPWMDYHSISPGQDWKFEIQNAISKCDAAIIFLSSKSVSKTGYVQVELIEFLEQRKRRPEGAIYLIPVRLDPCSVPTQMSNLHYADLFEPDGWDRVIASLKRAKREQSLREQRGTVGSTGDDVTGGVKLDFDEQEIGPQLRPVNEQLAALTAQIARQKGVEIAPLRAILVKLDESRVPDYEIPARLDRAVDELITLRT
jgi:hypothetical protein